MTNKIKFFATIVGIYVFGVSIASAQGLAGIVGKLNNLEKRLDALENVRKNPELEKSVAKNNQAISEIKKSIDELKADGKNSGKEVEVIAGLTGDLRELVQELKSVIDENALKEKKNLETKPKQPVSFYGYIKLDASYDEKSSDPGNFARWVNPDGDDNARFNMTARQTRFGLNINSAEEKNVKTSGKIEVDFYGGGAENKNLLLLRHSFMKIYFPNTDFSILAGQASDIISPLVPSTVNYVVGWWAGNIGYRRPQLCITKGLRVSEKSSLLVELAAARSIGGEEAGLPSLQGRSSISFPLFSKYKTIIGLSGHSGKEENDSRTWSANVDVVFPISNKLILKGEYWQGENLDSYLGGIGQGLNDGLEITGWGGWVSLSAGPFTDWYFNFGKSIDDPDDEQLAPGMRTYNSATFGNVFYNLNHAVKIGAEIYSWDTKYKEAEDQNSYRLQFTMIYKF